MFLKSFFRFRIDVSDYIANDWTHILVRPIGGLHDSNDQTTIKQLLLEHVESDNPFRGIQMVKHPLWNIELLQEKCNEIVTELCGQKCKIWTESDDGKVVVRDSGTASRLAHSTKV